MVDKGDFLFVDSDLVDAKLVVTGQYGRRVYFDVLEESEMSPFSEMNYIRTWQIEQSESIQVQE